MADLLTGKCAVRAALSRDGDNCSMRLRCRIQTHGRKVFGTAYGWRGLHDLRGCAGVLVGNHPRSLLRTYRTSRQKAGMIIPALKNRASWRQATTNPPTLILRSAKRVSKDGRGPHSPSFRGERSESYGAQLRPWESIATIVSMDSGPAPGGASRN